jgi:hypothetical protein
MYQLDSEAAWIVTDTLSTDLDGSPNLLVSKCAVIPHLEMVIGFTGLANIGWEWTKWVQSRVLARDIDMLDTHAQDALRFMCEELEIPDGMSSTVYHLGYSPSSNGYVGYAYRSTNDFESEAIQSPCFGIKPHPPEGSASPATMEEIIELAEAVRANEDGKAADERLYVGGELVLTQLSQRTIVSAKIHSFEDFEAAWLTMNANLNR